MRYPMLDTYLHTNVNRENYLLTPSEAGDLCVAKLFPPSSRGGAGSSSHSHGGGGPSGVKCEASRNLKWTISNTGIQVSLAFEAAPSCAMSASESSAHLASHTEPRLQAHSAQP